MSDKIRLFLLVAIFLFISFFVYNYFDMKKENKELNDKLVENQIALEKVTKINQDNSDMYNHELDRLKNQIAEINKINKDYDQSNAEVKETVKNIDNKIKDKTKEEKNKILKQELNNIINIINEK